MGYKCTYLFIILFLFACTHAGKMGRVKYAEGGGIESGKSITKCTPPSKRYAKSIEAKVKASIDSLKGIPKPDLDFQLTQTVTKLSDYTSQGLDIDLILFRLCEISNNRGFSATQTDSLFKIAIEAWTKKSTSAVSVTNNGINNGLMAGILISNQDINIPNNFLVSKVSNIGDHLALEIKPKLGIWNYPFVAYPLREDSIVDGGMAPPGRGMGVITSGWGVLTNNHDDTMRLYKAQSPATPQVGFVFFFKKIPSIIYFGDSGDSTKFYSVVATN